VPERKKNAYIPVIPRFFCDNCGAEVPRDSKTCHSCGRSFSSVRCPYCGFVGDEILFMTGCPVCGYFTPPADDESDNNAVSKTEAKAKKNSKDPVAGLPLWVYILTTAIFTAVLAALLFRVF
jgi:hypothetical protein